MQIIKLLFTATLLSIATICFSQEIVTDKGINKEILKEGKGEKPTTGNTVKVSIEGKLQNGDIFESGTMSFEIGDPDMIAGFNEVLPSMRKGEKAKVTLPPAMGYGEKGVIQDGEIIIPPNATLIFEIQLLSIK